MKIILLILELLHFFGLVLGAEVSYEGLGTFTDQPPWGGTDERPTQNLPNTPEYINTRFYLDTRYERDVEIYNTDMVNMRATTFDASKTTRIIVHGYIQNGDTAWLNEMSETHLAAEDVNSIRVGWMGGSLKINYFQVAVDTQVVGAEVGLMMKNIINQLGADINNFHCVGHSLGAHVCSYASNYLQSAGYGTIARITGLDPAGPWFQNTPNEVRLDSTDAQFVDALHTDSEPLKKLGFGISQQSGHIDFWPNNGLQQPGCDQNALTTVWDPEGVVEGVTNFVACNHVRAVEYYIESILTTCPFQAHPCPSYDDYLQGKCSQCGENCFRMGYHSIANKNSVSKLQYTDLYLSTAWQDPYCEFMVDVQVRTAPSTDDVKGKLYLSLYGSNENTEQLQLSNEDVELDLKASRVYSHLTHFLDLPDNLDHVKVLWKQEELAITSRRISVEYVNIFVGSSQKTLKFCGDTSVKMEPEKRYQLNLC